MSARRKTWMRSAFAAETPAVPGGAAGRANPEE